MTDRLVVSPRGRNSHTQATLRNQIETLKELNLKRENETAQLKHRAHLLSLETQVLQKTLVSVLQEKPHGQHLQRQPLQGVNNGISPSTPSVGGRQAGRGSLVAAGALSLERKNDLIISAVEAAKAEINKIRNETKGAQKLLKETQKNAELQAAEVRRDAFDFRRDVIVASEDQTTGSTIGEGLMRWLELRVKKWSKQEESLLRILRETKKKEIRKKQAEENEGRGSAGLADIQSIDIHQLQIENEQFAQKVEQSKADIAAKKRKCSIKLQTQASVKKELEKCMQEAERLSAALISRKAALEKTEKEIKQVAKEKEILKKETKRLLEQSRGSTQLPQVIDIVRQKIELQRKTRLLTSWKRKTEVAELEANTVRADLKTQAFIKKRESCFKQERQG